MAGSSTHPLGVKSLYFPTVSSRRRTPVSVLDLEQYRLDQLVSAPTLRCTSDTDVSLSTMSIFRPTGRSNPPKDGLDDRVVSMPRGFGIMVGRGGLEPPTSRLSGVRSNHLSYRPTCRPRPWPRQIGPVDRLEAGAEGASPRWVERPNLSIGGA